MNKNNISAYEVKEERKLSDIDSVGYVLRHKKSGARVVVIENDDNNKTFSIGFRTPPEDSTGVAHITEHSVLCGSEKFPVKDPFMELVKGSLNTFLNAMTYPDKTVYPVASTNEKDFHNLMDVYLDSVFHPNVYQREEIFCQEGVTYSLESKDSELKYNGVVYNEMKGAFSSPDDVIDRMITESLYPDTCYGVESGGDPDYIPDLTYQQFLDFHRRYYHPSNSYIYIYGDMDMEKTLNWLDERYLCEYDEIETDSEIHYQKPFEQVREMRREYSISEGEEEKDNTYLSYNFVTGDILDEELYLALQVLEYAIISMPGAPIKKALLEKGIGKDISGRYNNYILQPFFTFTAKKANEEDKEVFVQTIREELEKLVQNGIDKASLLAALNNYEFQYRENDFGAYPKGLMFSFQIFDSWLYDENNPFRHLEQNEQFAKLRALIDTDYFEKLIEKYFLNNTHASVVILAPVKGLTSRKEEALKKKLVEMKGAMSDEELDALVEKTKNLKKYQETPSTPEELDTIPILKREDLSREVEPFYNTETEFGGVKVVRHDIFTNGIAYFSLSFDITDVPFELLPYVMMLKGVLGYMDTERFSYSELSNEIGIHTGGIYLEVNVYRNAENADKYMIKLEFTGKVFADKIDKAIEIIQEIIFHTKLDDTKRLYEIICESKSNLQGLMLRASDYVATLRNLSYFSKVSAISEKLKGISQYQFIEELEHHFGERKTELVDMLEKLCKYAFRHDNLVISYTANNEGYVYFEKAAGGLLEALKENCSYADIFKELDNTIVLVNKNEGFKNSAQVQYVTRAGNFVEKGYAYDGSLKVLRTILNSEYLWKNIREKGGAYGCNCMFSRSGESYMSSYRDPNLSKTNEVINKAPDYIRDFDTDDRNMTKYVIGTISSMDTPLTAKSKGERSMAAYFNDEKISRLEKERLQVLETNQEKIRSLADIVAAIVEENHICVVGNEDKIEAEKELFGETVNLFH